MRPFLALSLLASTLSATTFFDPPNPTTATPVTAHVTFSAGTCTPTAAAVNRNGATVAIALTFPVCPLFPPAFGTVDYAVSLGTLPAGVYDVVTNGGLDRGTLVVRDAAPPFEIVPNVVPLNGGAVHLRGNGLIACAVGPSPIVCETPSITVSGLQATIVSRSQGDIDVVVPPHAPGAVDVTITRAARAITATAALDYYEFNKAPDAAFFEPVLFPALVTGPGAFGSQWSTDAAMRNDNDAPLPTRSTFFNVLCFPVCDTRPPAHATLVVHNNNAPSGIVFYAARQFAPRLFFDVLARDLSRQSEALGTEIPVAREKDLYDRPFSILLVPTDTKYRVALRVFRTDGAPAVRVNIYSMNADATALVSDVLLLTAPSPSEPLYTTQMIQDLVGRYPQLAGKGPLRIEVGEPSPRAVWALVSVTNNDTQHVTVLAPH